MKRWMMMSAAMASLLACCVARGTKVKTPRGNRKVEELEVGDELIVVDPNTLEQHVSTVTAIRRAPRECGQLNDLKVTSAHPLFDPREKVWAPAGDWLLGVREEFLTEVGAVRVTRAERFVGVEEVFDLTVAHELHTFVADGVVVHNKQPLPQTCPVPAPNGQTLNDYQSCDCGVFNGPEGGGLVACLGEGGAPICDCGIGFDWSSWATAEGTTENALRDGTWWSALERNGPGDVMKVQSSVESTPTRSVLPGSPRVLHITERGDGSAGFLVQSEPQYGQYGSIWFSKSGRFPRLLTVDGNVLLGVDDQRVWFQPAGSSTRWVANDVPSNTVLNFAWDAEMREDGGYVWAMALSWADGASTFVAENDGTPLDSFYADGGTFALVDGGTWALRLGHESATDGGTGELQVFGLGAYWRTIR